MKNLDCTERLKRLDLTRLKQRRKRGDLIQIYKMINLLEKIELVNGINFASSAFGLRGHNLKFRRELIKNFSPQCNFLTNRVVNDWNNLPVGVVKAKNLNIFKAMLDDWMKSSC